MPLFLDELDAKPYDAFDPQTASTLYWKSVPVLLRQSDREEQSEELSVRILSGHTRQNHNLRILRIHVFSNEDLFFLHTLEVTEEEFQTLKVEQGILVDFANFPSKIISLLEKCIGGNSSDAPRFQAVLTIKGAESTFKVVETNDFKQLPHITLAFRPGNDTAIKQFLAFRLFEVKSNCHDLTRELAKTKEERDDTTETLVCVKTELAKVKEQHDKHLLEVHAVAKTQQANAHEEKVREKEQLKEHLERERSESEKKLREQLDALNQRIAELDSDNRKLRNQKYELDTRLSELSHKLGTSEGSNRSLQDENERLKSQNQQLSRERHERDIQLNEARARAIALEEKVQAAGEVAEQQRMRLKELENTARQAESRCGDLRESLAAQEQRSKEAAAEVLKGNQIIEKLTNDLRLNKEKVKRKAAIVMRQEEELQQREAALSSSMREVQGLGGSLDTAKADLAALRSENGDLRGKLEEARQQLQSNEQMIRWLNQQVTEAQLNVTTMPSSRFNFKSNSMAGLSTPAPALLTSAPYTSKYTSAAMTAAPTTRTALPSSLGVGHSTSPGRPSRFEAPLRSMDLNNGTLPLTDPRSSSMKSYLPGKN